MELESTTRLFFGCVVARNVWTYACEFLGFDIGADFLSVAGKWLNKEKFCVANMISTPVLRGIWLVRNDFVFHQQVWSNVKLILRRILKLAWEWKILCKEAHMQMMTAWLSFLEWSGGFKSHWGYQAPEAVQEEPVWWVDAAGKPWWNSHAGG
jgi:hypothetical protein